MKEIFKNRKVLIAGFVTMIVAGIIGTGYILLTNKGEGNSETEDNDLTQEQSEEIDTILNFQNNDVSFGGGEEDKEVQSMEEDELYYYYEEAKDLAFELDFEGVVELLSEIGEGYDFSDPLGKKIKRYYLDSQYFLLQMEVEDPEESAKILEDIGNPKLMAYAFPHLPMDVFLYTVKDDNSAHVSGSGNVDFIDEEKYHPLYSYDISIEDEEEGGDIPMNEELFEIPEIALYLEMRDNLYALDGFWEFPMTVQGVEVTAYIASFETGDLELLGYYIDNQIENAHRFQSVNWHLAQRQRLEEAVNSNWSQSENKGDD